MRDLAGQVTYRSLAPMPSYLFDTAAFLGGRLQDLESRAEKNGRRGARDCPQDPDPTKTPWKPTDGRPARRLTGPAVPATAPRPHSPTDPYMVANAYLIHVTGLAAEIRQADSTGPTSPPEYASQAGPR